MENQIRKMKGRFRIPTFTSYAHQDLGTAKGNSFNFEKLCVIIQEQIKIKFSGDKIEPKTLQTNKISPITDGSPLYKPESTIVQ